MQIWRCGDSWACVKIARRVTNIVRRAWFRSRYVLLVQFGSSEVLIRALGPELTNFGITDALQDPKMELHDGNGTRLLANDNWKDSQQAAIQATGLAPGDDCEPTILTTLIQRNWTPILRSKTTSLALLS